MSKVVLKTKNRRLEVIGQSVLLLCGLLFLSRCTFSPHDEYISPIKPPEPIVVNIEVNSYTTTDRDPFFNNPYYLLQQTLFQFRLKNLNNKLASIEIKLDDKIIDSRITDNVAEFILNPNIIGVGNHTVKLTMYIDTESGSLLQRLGGEFYMIEQTFTVIIDPIPPDFNSFSANIENGYLTFRWNETMKSNFIYKIKRNGPGFGFLPDLTINNPNTNYFIDRGYVGGSLNYQVIASGFGFEKMIGQGSLNYLPGDFTVTKGNDAIVRLEWTQNYIATEGVQIEIKVINNRGQKNINSTFTSTGSIKIDSLGLTEESNVFASFYRNGYANQKAQFYWPIKAIPNIKPFTKYLMLKKSNKLLISSNKTIYRYNLNGIILEDSVSITDFGITELSSLIVNQNESLAFISGRPGGITSFDPLNLKSINQYDIQQATSTFANTSYQVSPILSLGNASNNGLITIAFWRGSNYTMVYDLNNDKALWYSINTYDPPILSNDGNYLAADIAIPYSDLQGGLYRFNTSQFDLLGKIDYGVYSFLANGNEVISYTRVNGYSPGERRISAYNYSNPPSTPDDFYNKVRSTTTPYSQEGIVMFDTPSNLIIIRYYEYSMLMDPETMSYVKTINQRINYFSNGYILLESGFLEMVK